MAAPAPATTATSLTRSGRFSYLFMAGLLILAGALHLATPLIASLFAFLALVRLHFFERRSKWIPVSIFLVLVAAAAYGLGYFVNQTVKQLPEIADKSVPLVIEVARKHQIELPFSDYDSLKDRAFEEVKNQVHYLAGFAKAARGAIANLIYLLVGCIVAISIFFNPSFEVGKKSDTNNLYSACCEEVIARFRTFFQSFSTVMGAQVIISAINTCLTAGFALVTALPYTVVIIGVTFLCGLLPVVGNLISNTLVVAVAFTVSPTLALAALVFLVVVHKLEYFLNSKIIGWRIHNPLWLTLLALILGEKLMGLPGMILAPVILNYVRLEASALRT
jgi:predicted PurR-regulated permease PerM